MSISHRTNRLKLVGQPSVEQLQNGRYRLTVTCSTINSREDWYSANKDRIFPDFGSLQSAEMSIDGLAPREGEAYTDMRLTKVESGNRSGMGAVGDYNVELTYETLGSAFVQVKDDTTDYELNGLRRVTRTSIAEAGTDYTKTVGTSFIDHQINNETAVRCYLASYSVDDTDSFRQVQEVYVEAGTLSETLDNVGSQKSKVIQSIGADPTTPDGYVLASKNESDFKGFQTNQFTFLKPSVLSRNVETRNNGKLRVETVEAFNETPASTIGGVQISIRESDVEGIPTNQYVFALGSGEVERSSQTKNQGALTITTVVSLGFPGTATGVEIEATTREEDGYILFRNVFADGNGEVSRTTETKNQGKLTVTTVESLGSEGSAGGIQIEATTREQDGYTLFRNTFADGQGEVSRTVETRNQGKLTVTTVEALGSAGTGTGVEIEATTREQDGYTLFRNVFADGNGEVSRTVETKNQGALTITTVEALGAAGSGTGVEIEATTREQDGYTLFRNTFANGTGEVSRTVETRNQGALTITTVEALGSAGSAAGVEIEATTREQDGYTLFRNTFAEGNGEVSRTTETRNKGALTITTVEALGAAGSATGLEIEATTREQDGYTLFRNTFADGQGEVSRSVETRNQGKLTVTTVESLGSAGTGTGVEIEATTREQDGYTLFRNTFADGNGEVSRTTETKNQGKLTVTTVEALGSAGTGTGVEIEATTREQDGYTLFRNVFADGKGEVSRTVEKRNKGKLTITTVEALGAAGTATGIEIEATTREQDGYTLFRNTFAQGSGEVSRSTETRNQGALTITTVEALGAAGTGTGVEIEATTREQDGYTLFRNTFADGQGEVSRTVEKRNKGKLTITTVEALGSAGTGNGVEIEATTREQDGYTLFRNTFAEGNGEVSRSVEKRNQGKLTVTTVEALGSAGTGNGVEIEATTREQDGYTLFRNVFADGQGEVSRTVEKRNKGKLTITTVEALGSAGSATGIEIEATTREQDGYTLFRNVFADGNGEVSRTTEKRNQGKLTVTTVEALGSAGTATGVEIEATTREQDGYTLFRNVFANGTGEVSRTVETRNQGKLTITTVEALGSAGSAIGVEIESTTREQDGYTLFRNVFADGQGEVSRTVEKRIENVLTITTVESLGEAGNADGIEIEETTREQDGYTLFRNIFADGKGEISRSEDNVGSQLAITTEVFNPESDPIEDGYSIARIEFSNVSGIPTKRFTFLKDDAELSRSEDGVGSQLAIVTEVFNPTEEPVEDDYVLARTEVSDVEGIPTKRFTFLKDDVILSETEDKVGSQLAIVQERFNPSEEPAIELYVIANIQVSDVGGIPTKRYTFLKEDVELSRSEDLVGSQLAIVTEVFNPAEEPAEEGYSLARTEVSDIGGIPTKRYTFLKDNVKLSETENLVGSQLSKVQEWFNPTDDPVIDLYVIADTQESDIGGIPTKRYTFLKNDVELSRSEDKVGSQLAIVTEVFNPESDPQEDGYSLARIEVSDVDGIPTKRYTFLKDDVELARSEDLVGSQKAIVTEVFKPEADPQEDGYSVARTEVSDVDGIPTKRFTFLKDNVKLSETEDRVGSQLAKVEEWFNPTDDPVIDLYVIANIQVSDFGGIPTKRFTFLKENVELSRNEDLVGSQLSITTEVFKPESDPEEPDYSVARKEESDVEGIPTKRFTLLKNDAELSRSEDLLGSQLAIVTEVFNPEIDPTEDNYSLARTDISDVDGIPTKRYTFLKDNVELSRSEDKVGSQLAITTEVFKPDADPTEEGYSVARTEVSDVDGIPTKRFTFLKPSILSLQQEFVGGATTVQVGAFGMTEAQVDTALSEVTASHILISQSEKDYNGIITSQFTYEVDDFEVESQAEDGMDIIVRTELSVTNFTSGVIGTDTYKTLFLTQESIDNGNTIKKRTGRYSEAGVLSISPLEEDGFSLAPSYVYVTTGAPASSMTGLVKPNGTALGTNVTWFEPKVQNVEGFSTYTQQVLAISFTATVKVHSVDKFFVITEPGIMSTGGSFNSGGESGAATRFPQATQQPRTYRKKATLDVYLTSVNTISETEVAFTEEGIDWCSVGFDSFYTNETESTASVSSNWRSFPQYLNSAGTTDTADASVAGKYYAEANSYGAGDTTYTTTGIYRVELEKYTRAADGTQLYLKTIVTF